MTRPTAGTDRIRRLLALDDALASGRPLPPVDHHAPAPLEDTDGSPDRSIRRPQLTGFDEAGRGALAGPVVVGCVAFEWSQLCDDGQRWRNDLLEAYRELDDSKRVSERKRERLYRRITADTTWGLGCASAREIDRDGIVEACCSAARRAYRRLHLHADLLLFDRGLDLATSGRASTEATTVHLTKGDARSFHIAAASIVAKVGRDALMRGVDSRYPAYGFAQHKGYGTAAHRTAIRTHGPSPLHRRTFLRSTLEK